MIDIRKLREEKNLSQLQLGRRCNVVRQMIGNIETGYSTPSVTLAKALGRELGFDWWKIFEDEEAEA